MESYSSAFVAGRIVSPITEDHTIYGETFYASKIQVQRLSGTCDTLPITIPGRLLADVNPEMLAAPVSLSGHIRSYTKTVDGQNRMAVTLFVRSIMAADEKDGRNEINVCGTICKQPVYRLTPFGREICDLMVAVNRNYSKSDYIPCIVWGRNASWATGLKIGDHVRLSGRMQSREYDKLTDSGEYTTRTAYELSAHLIEKVYEIERDVV